MSCLHSECTQYQLGSDLVADTTAETLTAVEDMAGFDEIEWVIKLGDVDAAAVLTFAVKENTASSTSSPTPTAVAGTAVTAGALTSGNLVVTESSGNLDDKLIIVNYRRNAFTKQYVFLSITATVESYEVDSITCQKMSARAVPVTQPSDVYAVLTAAS